ncbi:hypothetical protein [Actibacterium sp. 188UL27-1]|uniref:hypothetical protein n=1 Tax=Actibacterium sp. 188UL27-1 TaxID=2786961 RepID=UPI00195EC510|nr:hypothetical protein [Actibacterium sp. 188UL27-1]MBM7068362.1 hypothetical protein [Actibacterium sp. 188UL27-1]
MFSHHRDHRFRRSILGLVVGVVLFGWAGAGQSADRATSLEEAFQRCAAAFPDMKAVRQAHKNAGMRVEGLDNDLWFHSAHGRRVFAATGARRGEPFCMFGINRQGNKPTLVLAKRIIKKTFGKKALPVSNSGDRDVLAAWAVPLGKTVGAVLVTRSRVVSPYYSGSMIMIGEIGAE